MSFGASSLTSTTLAGAAAVEHGILFAGAIDPGIRGGSPFAGRAAHSPIGFRRGTMNATVPGALHLRRCSVGLLRAAATFPARRKLIARSLAHATSRCTGFCDRPGERDSVRASLS